jgi:hypothetical protein
MTDRDETPLEQAERHVAEIEARIARQREIIDEMERDHHPTAAATGRRVLAVMQETLRVLRRQVEMLRGV